MSAADLARWTAEGKPLLILNVGSSKLHRKGHIPKAIWVTRGYLERAKAHYPNAQTIVITADSDVHACFAAKDAAGLWPETLVLFLQGGNSAWQRSEFTLEEGMPTALCPEDDIWYKPYTDINAKPEAMKGYFDWEFGLVERIRQDGDVQFSLGLG